MEQGHCQCLDFGLTASRTVRQEISRYFGPPKLVVISCGGPKERNTDFKTGKDTDAHVGTD